MTRAKDISKITTAPTMGGLTYPTSDGSNGQFVKTDGSGNLSFATVSTTTAFDDVTAGDAAVNVTTTSGNITIDAQGSDTDIIFKGTDGSSDITALTLDMSDAGTAIFNHNVRLATDNAILNVGNDDDIALTHNGTNGSLTSGGNFNLTIGTDLTLDAGGDITLDADGGRVFLKDGGTTFGRLANSSSDFEIVSVVADKDIIFKGNDNGSEITALSLDMSNEGAVGMGTNSPVARLQVNTANMGNLDALVLKNETNNVNGYFVRFRRSSNAEIGSIEQTGGGATVSYNTSSDYRLKENVDYTFDATTRLKQLKPARFNFIGDTATVDGFLAHEVSDIVPHAISGKKDATENYTDENGDEQTAIKPQGIDHSKLVPLLVKTIQELEARITTLESA